MFTSSSYQYTLPCKKYSHGLYFCFVSCASVAVDLHMSYIYMLYIIYHIYDNFTGTRATILFPSSSETPGGASPTEERTLEWCHNERVGVSNHRLFRRRSKKTSRLHVTGLCERNSPMIGEFPAQRSSKRGNVFIGWRHNGHTDPVRMHDITTVRQGKGKPCIHWEPSVVIMPTLTAFSKGIGKYSYLFTIWYLNTFSSHLCQYISRYPLSYIHYRQKIWNIFHFSDFLYFVGCVRYLFIWFTFL